MKYLPLDVSSFGTMMTGNYVYIDKTQYIYNLFSKGGRLYFLSRPRRFGKSLLISTLKELFLGNRELFKGLWIDSSDYQWYSYPVVYFDFSTIAHGSPEELKKSFSATLDKIAQEYQISFGNAPTINDELSYLIRQLSQKNKVVILIDEYDKPILDAIDDLEKAEMIKRVIASIYEVIKSLDEYIRAVFVTGVTTFAKTSIFSGMNNLRDISFDKEAAQLLGYTQEEILHYFKDRADAIAVKDNVSFDAVLTTMREWYNGYRFSELAIRIYNPFSILYYLERQRLANYWFKSGTPTFLIHLIKQHYIDLELIPTAELKLQHLETFELSNIPLIPLLFQAGYLTVADYDSSTNKMTLNYPNFEIKESFIEYIVASLSHVSPAVVDTAMSQLVKALVCHDIEHFCTVLTGLIARIPYLLRTHKESYYHSLFHFLINLLILETHSEVLTHKGRIDTVVYSGDNIYIFELKVNKKPQEALQQIIDKKYYQAYLMYNKPIVFVGMSFMIDEQGCNIEYITKKYAQK